MIARHRGDERVHSLWRPAAMAGVAPSHWTSESEGLLEPDDAEPELRDRPVVAPRPSRAVIWLAVVIAGVVIAGHQQHGKSRPIAALPSSPRQWVDQWTAASLTNPARVCQQLLAPALAASFKADTGRSCVTYYSSGTRRSFRIRHRIEDGPTTAIEAQQFGDGRRWGYFTLILSHVHGGWQAVDVVPGGSVRPR